MYVDSVMRVCQCMHCYEGVSLCMQCYEGVSVYAVSVVRVFQCMQTVRVCQY